MDAKIWIYFCWISMETQPPLENLMDPNSGSAVISGSISSSWLPSPSHRLIRRLWWYWAHYQTWLDPNKLASPIMMANLAQGVSHSSTKSKTCNLSQAITNSMKLSECASAASTQLKHISSSTISTQQKDNYSLSSCRRRDLMSRAS